jgi:hypothetical protein
VEGDGVLEAAGVISKDLPAFKVLHELVADVGEIQSLGGVWEFNCAIHRRWNREMDEALIVWSGQ